MTHQMLYQCLVEARERVAHFPDEGVKARSQETVNLIEERLRIEGISEKELKRLARGQ